MKALVLCAGLGTRLRPLTEQTPKPLISFLNMPILEFAFSGLKKAGFTDVAINAHYLFKVMEQNASELAAKHGLKLTISREYPDILGSGGALVKLRTCLEDAPFLVYNGDIISHIDFKAFKDLYTRLSSHLVNRPVMLLAVRKAEQIRDRKVWCVAVDQQPTFESGAYDETSIFRVLSISKDEPALPPNFADAKLQPMAFASAYISSPSIFDFLPQEGSSDIFAALNAALDAGLEAYAVGYDGFWADIGSPDLFWSATNEILAHKKGPKILESLTNSIHLDGIWSSSQIQMQTANVPISLNIVDWAVIGSGVCWPPFMTQSNVLTLNKTIILPNTRLDKISERSFEKSIVFSDQVLPLTRV